MADFNIKKPEEFTSEIRKFETTDRNHADVFNAVIEKLINNDAFLKKIADAAAEHMKNNKVHVPALIETETSKYLRGDGTWQTPPDTNTTYSNMKAATASADGGAGLVPAPGAGAQGKYLRGDGTWQTPPDTNTTYGNATQSANGLMSADDKKKLDGVAVNANNFTYTHPANHAANMITEDATHRFVTDTEKANWNGKAAGNHTHSYLPLTGGTLTGDLISNSTGFGIKFKKGTGGLIVWGDNTNNNPFIHASPNPTDGYNQIWFGVQGWDTNDQLNYRICMGSTGNGVNNLAIWPYRSDIYSLGMGGAKFKAVYATTGTIQTSDRNQKKEIKDFEERFIQDFIMGLKPVSYMFKENESGRTHYGLIAQDVEELMNHLDMDSTDFAGFIKSPKIELSFDKETKATKCEVIEGEYDYGLRYEEFLSPLIKMVQIQQQKIYRLEKRVSKLEAKAV